MIATIKDVAARAGVSTKTVSRVINNEAHVRPHLREAVMRVVDELNYRPNAFARSLSSARSYLLALFINDPASNYATAMQRGALDRCRRDGYHLVVEPLDQSGPDWIALLDNSVRALRLDGAILAPPLSQSTALLDRLDELGVPYVCVSPDPNSGARSGVVGMDDEAAAFAMTDHLLTLGHRDIAFIEGDRTHAATSLRRRGFERAMADAGVGLAPGRVVPGDFSFRSGFTATEELLGSAARPSAIFASNDDMALGAIMAAMKAHLTVPDALSIAGFDDAATARLAWPPITTVRQPVAAMGFAAAGMLIDPGYRDDMRSGKFRHRLDYELILRESTAPA